MYCLVFFFRQENITETLETGTKYEECRYEECHPPNPPPPQLTKKAETKPQTEGT